jgi:hypothetical protein
LRAILPIGIVSNDFDSMQPLADGKSHRPDARQHAVTVLTELGYDKRDIEGCHAPVI